jgi:hypothetical protein
MVQYPSGRHNNTGVILIRLLTSGMFQRLMAEAFPETAFSYTIYGWLPIPLS